MLDYGYDSEFIEENLGRLNDVNFNAEGLTPWGAAAGALTAVLPSAFGLTAGILGAKDKQKQQELALRMQREQEALSVAESQRKTQVYALAGVALVGVLVGAFFLLSATKGK